MSALYIFRLLRSEIQFVISHGYKSIQDKKAKPRISLSYGKAFAGNMTSVERAIVSRSTCIPNIPSVLKEAKTRVNKLSFLLQK